MKRHAESAVDQDWWWHTFLTLGIVKDMWLKFRRHRKPRWPTPLSYDNYANSFKHYKPLWQQRHLRGHLLSQRRLLCRR